MRILLISLIAFITNSFQQDIPCIHPSNYSDFTLLLVNNSIIVTGGNTQIPEVWSRNISNGLSINNNCWNNITSTAMINTTSYSSYKNGIGFRTSNSSFAVQAGDYATPTMMNLSIFDLNTNMWSSPMLQGQEPSARSRMSVSVNETTNIAWFYGGRSEITAQFTNYFNKFYYFDITRNTWNWPEIYYSGGQRPARYGHSSNLISERLFIIGGKTAVFSKDSDSWIASAGDFQSVLVFDTKTYQGISMATIGDIPAARYSFSTVNAPDGKSIVLFGGQSVSSDQTLNATNDVYLLDTCTLNWTHIITKGTPPVARAGHEAISFNNRYMIVMMGIQDYVNSVGPIYIDDTAILDMETWRWVSDIPASVPYYINKYEPKCRFTFPVVIPNGDDGGDNSNGNDGNATVISGTNNSSTVKKLALGITFGVLGFLLLTTCGVIFIFRIRRDVDAKQNPRWLPNVLKKKGETSNHENYPLSIHS